VRLTGLQQLTEFTDRYPLLPTVTRPTDPTVTANAQCLPYPPFNTWTDGAWPNNVLPWWKSAGQPLWTGNSEQQWTSHPQWTGSGEQLFPVSHKHLPVRMVTFVTSASIYVIN